MGIIATGYNMSNPNTLYRLRINSANPVYNNTDSNRNIQQRDRIVYNSAFIRGTSSQYLMMILLDASDTIYWEQSNNGGSSWSTAVSTTINTKGNGNIYGQSTPTLIDGYVYTNFALNNWAEEIVTDLPVFTSIEDYNTYITNVYTPPVSAITSNGGGATHIAKVTGHLYALSNNLSDILIVAGGGGGGMIINSVAYDGADAGGISGSGTNSANQTTGYAFGQGESGSGVSGGGGGLYGGYKGVN